MARRINLVPQADRARTTTNFGVLGFVAAVILVLFALGLGYYLFTNTLNNRKDDLTRIEQETQQLQAQVNALAKYGRLDTERKRVEGIVESAYAGRTLISEILDKLSLVVPENVWFSSMDISAPAPSADPEAALGTLSVSGNTYSFEDVAQLLIRLQLVPALSNINLDAAGGSAEAVDPSQDVKSFSIGAAVKNTQPADAPLPMSQVEVEGQ
jgi:Tfp pilus assembly protein PilN